MIVRYLESCPKCGQWEPWRQYSKKVKGIGEGEAVRKYVKCKRCGHLEVISVRKKPSDSDL